MERRLTVFKRIISVVLFAAILLFTFTRYGYVMRTRNGESNHITGITEVDNVDVVFVGTSATYTSWLPYRAWDEYGITSYDYATSISMIGAEVGTIRYIQHRQPDTKLYVIDIRSYLKSDGDGHIPVAKTNTMSYSFDRIYTILDCYNLIEDKSTVGSPLNHIFDILANQSNREALGDDNNWSYINNDVPSKYLGCDIISKHMVVDEPPAWVEDEANVGAYAERSIRHLLEYAQKNDIEILFTLIPYGITEEQIKKANRMEKIIEEYDGNYLNMCSNHAPYDVDYSKEFYNPRHVNILGAQKYTHYLGKYILDNFDIADHRGDEKYAEWDTYLEDAYKAEAKAEKEIEESIQRKAENSAFMANLSDTDDFYEWFNRASLAEDLSIFMVAHGSVPKVTGDTENLFSNLGFADEKKDYYHWISSCGDIDDADKDTVEGTIDARESNWTVTQTNDAGSIVIDGRECSLQKNGINVVAWDDNKAEIVDLFTLVSDGNGGLKIERGELPEADNIVDTPESDDSE